MLEMDALAQIRHCRWQDSLYRLGVRFLVRTGPDSEDSKADYHDFLRRAASGGNAQSGDPERFHKAYRALSLRYHPDNRETGDTEVFLSIREVCRIASPAAFAVETASHPPARDFRNAFRGSKTERHRRLNVLGLLYQRRMTDCEDAGLSLCDIGAVTGVETGALSFTLWYLREKGLVTAGDGAAYAISVAGVDLFESAPVEDTHVEEDTHLEDTHLPQGELTLS
jgi:hypothetical protein